MTGCPGCAPVTSDVWCTVDCKVRLVTKTADCGVGQLTLQGTGGTLYSRGWHKRRVKLKYGTHRVLLARLDCGPASSVSRSHHSLTYSLVLRVAAAPCKVPVLECWLPTSWR